MAKMKLILNDTDTINLLRILKENKFKHMSLSALAAARSDKKKFSKNAEKVRSKHKAQIEVAEKLMNKIAEQL
jgi:hypothetical protein